MFFFSYVGVLLLYKTEQIETHLPDFGGKSVSQLTPQKYRKLNW